MGEPQKLCGSPIGFVKGENYFSKYISTPKSQSG